MTSRLRTPAVAVLLLVAACARNDLTDPTAPASPPKPSFNLVPAPGWTRVDISPVKGGSYAWKINDRSEVVGWSNKGKTSQAWFRSKGGKITWLQTAPRAIGSYAFAISNQGYIAGTM